MESYLRLATSLVAGMHDGALLLDRNLQTLAQNRAALEILGVRARPFIADLKSARCPFDLLGNQDAEELARQCLEHNRVIHLNEVPFALPGGQQRTADVSFVPVAAPESDEVLGLIYLFRDVSAESRMQQHYTGLLASERARADELEKLVQERTEKLRQALEEVTRLARIDPLTGALNRRAFTELAEEAVLLAERHHRALGLLICDLDHFKKVNDTYGHQAGDALLVATVGALVATVRRTDKIGRFGGEEFVVLLSETAGDKVLEVGERCREAIMAIPLPELVPGASGQQTISVGCAVFPDHGKSLDTVLAAADAALYRAKERGRNRVEICRRSP